MYSALIGLFANHHLKWWLLTSEKLKPIRVELKELYNIKSKLDTILRQQRAQEINENRKENHAQEKETH